MVKKLALESHSAENWHVYFKATISFQQKGISKMFSVESSVKFVSYICDLSQLFLYDFMAVAWVAGNLGSPIAVTDECGETFFLSLHNLQEFFDFMYLICLDVHLCEISGSDAPLHHFLSI
jgi:hypothetical protein